VRPSRGVILYHLNVEKKSNLDKINLSEIPSQKWPTTFEVVWLLGQMS
jgi:hypothetical protein